MLTKINSEELKKGLTEMKDNRYISDHQAEVIDEIENLIIKMEDQENYKSLTAMADELSQDLAFKDFVFANIQKFGGEISALHKAYLKQKKS